MLRPLIGVSATALMILGSFASAQPQGRGRPPGPPPALPGVRMNPPIQNQQFQNPSFQRNQGFEWNQNRNWNNGNQNRFWFDSPYSTRWSDPYPYGGYNSVWYTPFVRWNVPLSGRAGFGILVAPTEYIVPEVSAVVPAEVASREQGLRITEVFDDGTAKMANLRAGDVILGVGQTRTPTFESLRLALLGNTETEIVFINRDNNKVEKMPVKVENGRIGVAVVPVAL